MKINRVICGTLLAGAAAVAIPGFAQRSPDSGPIARYDMRAGTTSGMGGMGQINPMALMMGGGMGGQVQHELLLRLGSSNTPDKGKAKADHFMPSGAKLGKSVALSTPNVDPYFKEDLPTEPRGRILLYWGCGEHAPTGQPVVIDLANLAKGSVPEGLYNSAIVRDWGPTLQNSTTFGHWPSQDGKYVKADSSLLGAHRIAGNYSPDISFNLTKDFMSPLQVSVAGQASGASLLSWTGIADATGYVASLFGAKNGPDGDAMDLVMWSSSSTRQFGSWYSDWLSPGQVAPLVKDKTILSPETTSCTVPAEVLRDAPDFRVGTLNAFGPEENFSYPPRPDDASTPWNLQWTARVRHRSITNWMEAEGISMGTANDSFGEAQGQEQPQCKPKRGGMFGGIMGGILGGNGC